MRVQMASARGSLPPLEGSSFSFNNTMMDAEMTDAPRMGQHPHDQRCGPCLRPLVDL